MERFIDCGVLGIVLFISCLFSCEIKWLFQFCVSMRPFGNNRNMNLLDEMVIMQLLDDIVD